MTTEQTFLENPITDRYNNSGLTPYNIPGLASYKKNSPIYIDHIIKCVLTYTGFPLHKIVVKSRERELVYARQLCFYFLRQKTTLSLKTIGAMFGGRDHTTVIHGNETIMDLLFSDSRVKEDVNRINERL